MKRIHTSLILSAAFLAVWSCHDTTDQDLYKLNVKDEVTVVSGADIAFKAIGGEGYIEVDGLKGTLEVKTAQTWCHLTAEGNKIHVSVDEYSGLESRYAVVEMKSGDAEGKTIVHQFGIIIKDFSPTDIGFRNVAAQKAFHYDANETVIQARTDADWIVLDNTTYSDSLVVQVLDNPAKEYREGEVRWNIGEMTGTFFVSQFDLADAGLLGAWQWHGKQTGNNRDFPMNATLNEEADGTYSLDIDYATTSVTIDITIPGITMARNCLLIPLGQEVGTYTTRTASYKAFTLVATGNGRITYDQAVTSGFFRMAVGKTGTENAWRATAMEDDYPEQNFRFEMWNDSEHSGTSSSGLILKEIYMDKK